MVMSVLENDLAKCRWERHYHTMKYKVRRKDTGLRKVTAAGAVVKTSGDEPGNSKGRAHDKGISQKNSNRTAAMSSQYQLDSSRFFPPI